VKCVRRRYFVRILYIIISRMNPRTEPKNNISGIVLRSGKHLSGAQEWLFITMSQPYKDECNVDDIDKLVAAFNAGLNIGHGGQKKQRGGDETDGAGAGVNEGPETEASKFAKAGDIVRKMKKNVIDSGGLFGFINDLKTEAFDKLTGCSQTVLQLLVGKEITGFTQSAWNAVLMGVVASNVADAAISNMPNIMAITGWTADKVAILAMFGAVGVTVNKINEFIAPVAGAAGDAVFNLGDEIGDDIKALLTDNRDLLVDAINSTATMKSGPTGAAPQLLDAVQPDVFVSNDITAVLNQIVEAKKGGEEKDVEEKEKEKDVEENDNKRKREKDAEDAGDAMDADKKRARPGDNGDKANDGTGAKANDTVFDMKFGGKKKQQSRKQKKNRTRKAKKATKTKASKKSKKTKKAKKAKKSNKKH